MFGFIKIWKWRIFHRKKKEKKETTKTGLDNLSEDQIKKLALEIQKVNDTEPEKEKKEKPQIPDVKPTVYPSRNMGIITTESDMKLRPIKVLDDHMIEYNKKKIRIKYDRPAHIIDINLHELMPTKKQRIICKLFGVPKFQTYRAYTFQAEGELTHDPNPQTKELRTKEKISNTHDPHPDGLDESQKMRFEKLIQLEAVAVKAAITANIMAGLKDRAVWWEKLGPLLILAIVVAFFLFAFQVQPNM